MSAAKIPHTQQTEHHLIHNFATPNKFEIVRKMRGKQVNTNKIDNKRGAFQKKCNHSIARCRNCRKNYPRNCRNNVGKPNNIQGFEAYCNQIMGVGNAYQIFGKQTNYERIRYLPYEDSAPHGKKKSGKKKDKIRYGFITLKNY